MCLPALTLARLVPHTQAQTEVGCARLPAPGPRHPAQPPYPTVHKPLLLLRRGPLYLISAFCTKILPSKLSAWNKFASARCLSFLMSRYRRRPIRVHMLRGVAVVPQQPQEANPPASALEAQPGPQVGWCPGAEQEAASTVWKPWPQALQKSLWTHPRPCANRSDLKARPLNSLGWLCQAPGRACWRKGCLRTCKISLCLMQQVNTQLNWAAHLL